MEIQEKDLNLMKKALKLARKGIYTTSPNPMVGAVIVSDDEILATGYHHHSGGDHAEICALKKIKKTDKALNLYINLEPCTHYGKTSPCVDEILKSPIKKVFISTIDPNPLVNGKGIEKLKKAGIEVSLGLLEREAIFLNRVFFYNQIFKMPYVILKWAATLDGYIADHNFESKWITNDKARKIGKSLREEVDGILVGANTVLRDNPRLDREREHPPRKKIKKIVIDPLGKIPLNYNLFQKGEVIWILKDGLKKDVPENVKILNLPLKKGIFQIDEILKNLKEMGINSLLIEGGSKTASLFLKNKMVQEVVLFYGSKILGGGIPAFKDVNLNLKNAIKINMFNLKKLKSDFYLRGLLCSLELLKAQGR